jgi:hypothetical protein
MKQYDEIPASLTDASLNPEAKRAIRAISEKFRKQRRDDTLTLSIQFAVGAVAVWLILSGSLVKSIRYGDAETARNWCKENSTECVRTACEAVETPDCLKVAIMLQKPRRDERLWSPIPDLP